MYKNILPGLFINLDAISRAKHTLTRSAASTLSPSSSVTESSRGAFSSIVDPKRSFLYTTHTTAVLIRCTYLFTGAGRPSPRRTRARDLCRSVEPPAALPSMVMIRIRPEATHICSRTHSLDAQPHYQHAEVGPREHTHVYDARGAWYGECTHAHT